MPAAATLMRTSPGPGAGTGRVTGTSTSGPPAPFASMTVIVFGSMFLAHSPVMPAQAGIQ